MSTSRPSLNCRTNTEVQIGFCPNVRIGFDCEAEAMNTPEQPEALPLEYAAQIASELNSMRRECSQLAGCLLSQDPANERGVADCARLDSVLAGAHGVLREAVRGIRLLHNLPVDHSQKFQRVGVLKGWR